MGIAFRSSANESETPGRLRRKAELKLQFPLYNRHVLNDTFEPEEILCLDVTYLSLSELEDWRRILQANTAH